MRRRLERVLIALACAAAFVAHAQDVAEEQAPAHEAAPPEEVVVTGEYPGPGLWKVTRPDDPADHTLWILGDPPPLPKKMKWKSSEVEAVLRRSQEVLMPSALSVKPDEKIGVFKGLTLLPAALSARKNPDGRLLREVVPEDLYARWLVQKKRYLGSDRGVEKHRPIVAAVKLQREAFDDMGLRFGQVSQAITSLAKKHKIPTTTPTLNFVFSAKDAKAKIRQIAREPLADTECFAVSLDLAEALADRDASNARATAWATGDLDALAAAPTLPNPLLACATAVLGSQVAQEIIPSDARAQLETLWVEAAERSLATNETTFALLPLSEILASEGRLAALRAKGYNVRAPSQK